MCDTLLDKSKDLKPLPASNETLIDCPFCGEKPVKGMGYDWGKYGCATDGCVAAGKFVFAEKWNQRPSEIPSQALIEWNEAVSAVAKCFRDVGVLDDAAIQRAKTALAAFQLNKWKIVRELPSEIPVNNDEEAMSRCRKEFEEWMNDPTARAIERSRESHYILLSTQNRWEAWYAAYAAGYNMRDDEVKAAMA